MVLTGALVVSASVPSLGNMMETQNDEVRVLPYSVLYNETGIERSTSGALEVWSEQDKPYTYEFGNITKAAALGLPTTKEKLINTVVTPDGLLTINGNDTMSHNGDNHGLALNNGNTIDVVVAGGAEIAFNVCEYSSGGT